jgi:hypothetical protein
MEMRLGCSAGLHVNKIEREATIAMRRLGRIISVIVAVTMGASGCGFVGNTGRYVQARWVSGKTEMTLPEVKPGVEENISFEMNITQNASSLRLEVAHGKFKEMGISIPDVVVTTESGTVSSTVRFLIKANTPARRYVLTILARDAATGRVVARAEIPFAVYPYSMQRLFDCSC